MGKERKKVQLSALMNVTGVTVAISAELAGQTCVIHTPAHSTGLLHHSLAYELRLRLKGKGWVTWNRRFDTSIKESVVLR